MLIFWTFAFPIILGTFFKMAFSNIEKNEKLDIIDIAIVENENFNQNFAFKETFKVLSDKESEDRLFNTVYVTEKEAKNLLDEDKIIGYLILEDEPKVVVKTSGIDETILKYVTEEITQTEETMRNVAEYEFRQEIEKNPVEASNLNSIYASVYQKVIEMTKEGSTNIENISSANLSYTMIEYYTLIAMACLYGGILGMVSVNQNLANMSSNGKRVAVSPTSKGKLIFSSVLASYITQIIGVALLFLYTILILKVDYGENLLLIILLALVGCLAGLSLGIVIACVFKTNDNAKTGIVIAVTMVGCFLSGMMGITMKYIVDKNIPIINKLNPASMITDGFYSLYYYDTLDRYYFNIASLFIFSLVMIGISIFSLRRQQYDSI
ncbi:MAG: ABC transporter permease [Clostridia bacterium]|nr:ABC transporter permease [Clostridia bacterium]